MGDARQTTSNSYILALGFGISAAMWTVGYIFRIPPAPAPGWLVLALMLLCIIIGGYLAGCYSGKGIMSGAYAGMVSALLNMMILGSLVSENAAAAAIWVPGSIIVSGVLGLVGAAIGMKQFNAGLEVPNWTTIFAMIAVCTTFLLVVAGGLVTSFEAGLAVVDWPNTEGQFMFMYPLARMTGGLFYEHSHRLIGSLVGLTTLVFALHLQFSRRPSWIKWLGWGAFLMVAVQGILGGLRVTGTFTTSVDPAETTPNLLLAVIHGVVGQMFLALLVALATYTSRLWLNAPAPIRKAFVATDRGISISLVALIIVQLVLGAIQRHFAGGLHIHITLAVVVIGAALTLGVRMWGIYTELPLFQRLGLILCALASFQLILGLVTLAATGASEGIYPPPVYAVAIATAHQAVGAFLLAISMFAAIWTYRALSPVLIKSE